MCPPAGPRGLRQWRRYVRNKPIPAQVRPERLPPRLHWADGRLRLPSKSTGLTDPTASGVVKVLLLKIRSLTVWTISSKGRIEAGRRAASGSGSYGFRTYRVLELALYHSLGKLPEPESTHDFF